MILPVHLPPLRLTGATILRGGELQRRSLSLADGRIVRGPLPELDLTGYLLLPGIVDLHASAPIRASGWLSRVDRANAAQGITTAFLAQDWSWSGGPGSPDSAETFLSALAARRPQSLTELRALLIADIHAVESGSRLLSAVARHRVGYVVFCNALDDAAEMRRLRPEEFARWAADRGRTPSDMAALIDTASAQSRAVPRHLCRLADMFDEMGVLYGSNGDPDGETRERYSMIGARIAECPGTRRAAAAARAMMSPVLASAPAVLAGASTAADLLAEGLCDALVSCGEPQALAATAWMLADSGRMPISQAWGMISSQPAEVLRLADRGHLDPGMRADIVVVNATTREVEATICAGRLVHLVGEAERRFQTQAPILGFAAE